MASTKERHTKTMLIIIDLTLAVSIMTKLLMIVILVYLYQNSKGISGKQILNLPHQTLLVGELSLYIKIHNSLMSRISMHDYICMVHKNV